MINDHGSIPVFAVHAVLVGRFSRLRSEPGTWNLEPRIWNQRALITDQIQYIQYWAVDSVIAVIAVHSVHAVLISTFGSRQVYLPSKILLILANTAITAFTEDSTFQLLASSFSERVTNEFIGIT